MDQELRLDGFAFERMFDDGDSVPPDVRFAGKTCVDESSALVDQLNRAAVPKSEERRNEVA